MLSLAVPLAAIRIFTHPRHSFELTADSPACCNECEYVRVCVCEYVSVCAAFCCMRIAWHLYIFHVDKVVATFSYVNAISRKYVNAYAGQLWEVALATREKMPLITSTNMSIREIHCWKCRSLCIYLAVVAEVLKCSKFKGHLKGLDQSRIFNW